MTKRCGIPEERLLEFVAGELPESQELRLALHMGECGGCREKAVSFGLLKAALGDLDGSDAIRWHRFPTPFGPMFTAASTKGISRVSWQAKTVGQFEALISGRLPGVPVVEDADALAPAERQITEYFQGARKGFDLPIDFALTSSAFQKNVLEAASIIPFGQVISYGELATRIDNPNASRAVGNALGGNPLAIVIPCHRIVRGDGSAGGYTGGTEKKMHLLDLEQAGVRA